MGGAAVTVVALASAKASPGVTTTALALAAAWPDGRPVTVFEADTDGGDLAAWLGLASQPSLVTLAAEGRHRLDGDSLARHTQSWPGTAASFLVSPVGVDQTGAALAALARAGLADALVGLGGGHVLVDCGRLRPGGTQFGLLPPEVPVVLVARPTLAEVAHVRAAVAVLDRARRVGVVLVGERPYPADDVAAAVGVPVLGLVSLDRRAAAGVASGRSGRVFARSLLGRSAAVLAGRLLVWAGELDAGPGPHQPEGVGRVRVPAGGEVAAR